jgi:hypothetical protein
MMVFLKDLVESVEGRRKLRRVSYVLLVLVVLVDFLISHEGAHFAWEAVVGFGAVYGFISCVLIIVVSKMLGHYWLVRDEDYYE